MCAARIREHNHNLAYNIMLPQEKHIRKVIKGCFERGVQVSEELAYVFVSARCNQLLYYIIHKSTNIKFVYFI